MKKDFESLLPPSLLMKEPFEKGTKDSRPSVMQEESERVAYDTMMKADGLSSGTTATCDEGIDAMGVDAMDEDGDISANPRKRKGKATRWKIPPTALQMLEQVFKVDKFPSVETRKNLAANLKVNPRQVQVWFQNKRQRAVVPSKTPTPNLDVDVKGRMGGAQIPPSGAVDATLQQRDVFAGEYVAPDPSALLPSLQEASLAEMYLTLCQMRQIALPAVPSGIPQSVHPNFGTRFPASIQSAQHGEQMGQCAVQQPNQQLGGEPNTNELSQLQPTSAVAGANSSGTPFVSALASVWGVGGAPSGSGGGGGGSTPSLYPPVQLTLAPGSACALGGTPSSHPIVLGLPLGHLAMGSNPSEASFDAPAPTTTAPHSFSTGTAMPSAFAGPPNLSDVPPGLLLAASNAAFATSDPSHPHSWASSLRMQQMDVSQVIGGLGGLTSGFGGSGSLSTANVSASLPARGSSSSMNIAPSPSGTASGLSARLSTLAAHMPLLSAEHAAVLAASANEAASFQANSLIGAVHSASLGPSAASMTKTSVDVAARDHFTTSSPSTHTSTSVVADGQEPPADDDGVAAAGPSCGTLSPIDSFGSLLEIQRAFFEGSKATTVSQLNDLLRHFGTNSALASPELMHVQQQLGLEQQLTLTASLGASMSNPSLSVGGNLHNAMKTATQVDGRSPSEMMDAEVAEELSRENLHGQRLSTQQGATNGQLEGGVYDELINSLFNDESTVSATEEMNAV